MIRSTFPFDKRDCNKMIRSTFPSTKQPMYPKRDSSHQIGISSTRHQNDKLNNANAVGNQIGLCPVIRKNRITKTLSPRERVQKASRIFKIVYEELHKQNAEKSGESKTSWNKIYYHARMILVDALKQVNAEKMIGAVPGIEVGDEFQYKAELNLIGLHFFIQGGIDYIDRGDRTLATSIVASEGSVYNNNFKLDVVIYSGQGGNMTSRDHLLREDQRLARGNLALANSMRANSPVRVIHGKKRLGEKRYVYVGLYLVEDYWPERGDGGHVLFKFKLRRISGQPFVDLKNT